MKLCDKSASHMLSMIAAIYGVFIYAIAFSLEMWFIITIPVYNYENYDHLNEEGGASESIPVFAFILAAIYFVTIVVSLLLMLGIIIKSIMCLMSWLITIVLIFFPECGLVLYMSIEKWGIESRNGQIELCLFIIRAIMNVFFMVCVQNLISQWKTEKQVSSYAMSMSNYNCNPQTDPYPFINTNSTTINPVFKFTPSINGGHVPTSEFDTRSFQDLVKSRNGSGVGTTEVTTYGQGYSTQSLDRRKMIKLRSSHSFKEEVILRPLHHHPFDYLLRPGSNLDLRPDLSNGGNHYYQSKTLPRDFGDKNSSTHSIRDVAL